MASKISPITFFKQVRAEISKVTWPTRRETIVSTAFVLVMVLISVLFLFVADKFMEWSVWGLIGLF